MPSLLSLFKLAAKPSTTPDPSGPREVSVHTLTPASDRAVLLEGAIDHPYEFQGSFVSTC